MDRSQEMFLVFLIFHLCLILGDIFAEALLEDLTPRVEPQDLQLPISGGQFPLLQQVPEARPMTSDDTSDDVDNVEQELVEEAAIRESVETGMQY